MSDALYEMTVKEICEEWVKDGRSDDCFWEGWPECPTPEHSLTPQMVLDALPQWQPIETAPRDGTQFMFDAPQMVCGVSIGMFDGGVMCSGFDGKPLGDWVTPPTHWMPLPEPPK